MTEQRMKEIFEDYESDLLSCKYLLENLQVIKNTLENMKYKITEKFYIWYIQSKIYNIDITIRQIKIEIDRIEISKNFYINKNNCA